MTLKYIKTCFFLLVLSGLTFSSCYKESDWLGDNTTTEGKHFPVIAGFELVTEGGPFSEGTSVQLDLDFWSLDAISSIKLYERVDGGDPVEVASFGYTANFQDDSQTDELIMSYTIPSLPADTVQITLDAEVVNENGLTRNTKDGDTSNRPSITFTAVK
ncbi:MAG: hypothetical protein DHS20C18_42310 [Saprospiraceae bacterium]|nr:MAG: hypothetical protein DHS20C18_42310 [Saprospiraceae bacterium]